MKKHNKTPLAAAMGVAVVSTFSATLVNAEANPFGMTELSGGYMQVAEADKTGEMKCGASMNMEMPMPKTTEGACAGAKKSEAKPADAAKSAEGKCGEGKCAAMMEDGKMKKGMESACGAMMKGKEGACGATGQAAKEEKPAAEKSGEGKCGEGKCAAMMEDGKMKKGMESVCGAMMKGKEGECGANKKAAPAAPAAPAPVVIK